MQPDIARQGMSPKIDPITRSVVQHRLGSIVKEMGEAMLRTSYSQILNSSRDFSLAITDTRGRLIAQAEHIPVHVGALPWATRAVEERFKEIGRASCRERVLISLGGVTFKLGGSWLLQPFGRR